MRQEYAGCFTYQNKMYLAGGYNGTSSLSQITEFDPVTGTASYYGGYYQFRDSSCVMDTQNGIVYTFGNYSTIYKYDFNLKQYSTLIPTGTYSYSANPGLAIVEDNIYIFSSSSSSRYIYRYNITNNEMARLNPILPVGGKWKCVYPGNGDYIYGYVASGAYIYTVPFNFKTGVVTENKSQGGVLSSNGLNVLGAVVLDNIAYVAVSCYSTSSSSTLYNLSGYVLQSELKGTTVGINLSSKYIEIPAITGTASSSSNNLLQVGCVGLIGTEIYIMGVYNSTTANNTKICKEVINTALEQDNIRIQTATEVGKYQWLAVNSDTSKLKVSLKAAYKGDENNLAKQIDAYLNIDGTWKTLTGKTYSAS